MSTSLPGALFDHEPRNHETTKGLAFAYCDFRVFAFSCFRVFVSLCFRGCLSVLHHCRQFTTEVVMRVRSLAVAATLAVLTMPVVQGQSSSLVQVTPLGSRAGHVCRHDCQVLLDDA